jgi:uncharacterized membrane protein (DUF4010 family)
MIGIERGWRMRREPSGTRVAGVRTFTMLGFGGALAATLGARLHAVLAVALATAMAAALVIAFARDVGRRDATGIIAALLALGLGLLAGTGQPALAVGAAAIVTLILATRRQSHRFIASLTHTDVQAFARYVVIAAAVLPFLPNRNIGPLLAWNPFQLWLVVVLVTGFSFLGYVANRAVGAKRGILATALIGGAYSSTAVTASLAERLGKGEAGPLSAGILTASAVMFVRVIILVTLLSPSTLLPFLAVTGPATLAAFAVATFAWARASKSAATQGTTARNPIELLPAFGFVAIVAAGALATRWAQQEYGESGVAASLFITGTFDVDAAIVTLSGLPAHAVDRSMAAIALAGTIIANMFVKLFVAALYARRRSGPASIGLAVSTVVLSVTVAMNLATVL